MSDKLLSIKNKPNGRFHVITIETRNKKYNFNKTRIMKAIKYLVMGALMLGFGTPVMAQDGSKADIDAVKNSCSDRDL